MSLKNRIRADMTAALRAGDQLRLSTLRMLLAAVQQREVDQRAELGDEDVLRIIEKAVKQRREAARQYADAGRPELEQKETAEADLLRAYLPEPLGDAELDALIRQAIDAAGAAGMRDMGKVMAALSGQVRGRADMSAVSARVKALLGG